MAGPSDVAEERKILGEVIDDINRTASDAHTLRLELRKWETDSYPGFGEDAQDVINQQMGDKYDIFLGIMWGRFGSPTPRAGSGTEEEFNRAFSRWKDSPERIRIMFYFKDAGIPPSKSDPQQLEQVRAFKEKISDQGGLYREFQDAEDFRTQARRHLIQVIQDWPKPALSAPETAETTTTLTERRVKAAEANVRVAQEGHGDRRMKRDMDLVRAILLVIEENEAARVGQPEISKGLKKMFPNGPTWRGEQLIEHVQMMKEADLVEANIVSTMRRSTFTRLRMTWQGHDFIADARDEGIWKKAKEKSGDMGLAVLKQVLAGLVKQAIS